MTESALWIIGTGILVSWIGGLLGSFLVLRKMAMITDAISHAVLPGIVIAFLITGSVASFGMICGAAAFGLLASIFIQFLNNKIRLQTDASIGLVYTLLFSIGIVLVSAYASNTDLDLDCILFGEIAYVPLSTVSILGFDVPEAFTHLFLGLLLTLGFVGFGFRGLTLSSFDPHFAASIGTSLKTWQYLLMGFVAVATVLSFEAVGVILVVAFLTIPAASAYLLTTRLKKMIGLSLVFGTTASILGYFLANFMNTSISATMAFVAMIQFLFLFLFRNKITQRQNISLS